jgi:hypothetical protein
MAAGQGFKTFTTGEVLTAGDVNGYLMQGINVFTNATARDAAITAPAEGQFAFTKDNNSLWYYDGAAWVASGATGDIEGVTAGTGITGGGTSGTVTVSFDQANFGGGQYAAGKNKIINGDMRISQRGTSFTIASPTTYTLDRYFYDIASAVPTGTVSQQTFTPGTAPVAGYEAVSFLRVNSTANNGCTAFQLIQRIEDVRTFAGQTVTFSFWAKADGTSTFAAPALQQVFGSGGSGTVTTAITMSSTTLGTGWTRYTGTVAVPSISGKTVGTSSYLQVVVTLPTASSVFRNGTYDYWGWQLEAGSTATPFQTATGSIQGELAACQRYYYLHASGTGSAMFNGFLYDAGYIMATVFFPVTMRIVPSFSFTSGTNYYTAYVAGSLVNFSGSTWQLNTNGFNSAWMFAPSSGVGGAAGAGVIVQANNAAARFAFAAEL